MGQAGLTIGFWSNKNGAKLIDANNDGKIDAPVFNLLKPLNLRNADGSLFIKATDTTLATATFQSWLKAATAKNMANMLSAQLAGTVLNVYKLFVDSSLYIDFEAVTVVGGGAHLSAAMIQQLNAHGLGSHSLRVRPG